MHKIFRYTNRSDPIVQANPANLKLDTTQIQIIASPHPKVGKHAKDFTARASTLVG